MPQLDPFMPVLLLGMIVLGVPHGGLDIFILKKLSSSSSQLSQYLFVYLVGIAAMVISWILIPNGAFLFFILFSCFHFSHSDLSSKIPQGVWWSHVRLEYAARFFIPFFIPFGFNTERSLSLASQIHPELDFRPYVILLWLGAVLALILSVSYLLVILIKTWNKVDAFNWSSVEILVLCALFSFVDPLFAFGIYFSFFHALKHIIYFLSSPIPVKPYQLVPFCLIPLLGIITLSAFGLGSATAFSPVIFKWSIIMISSIALPHTFLVYLCKTSGLLAPQESKSL
jgi:Brp/Blh family beta-carotene 15,15'-monooxygenase